MCSKIILFLSSCLLLVIMFERIQNNIVFTFYFKYGIKESDVAEKLLFRDYLKKFNKFYERGEFQMRYLNFKENLKEIERLNRGSRHATYGVTKFSDWTREELEAMLLPNVGKCEPVVMSTCGGHPHRKRKNKGKMGWRKEKAVGPVLSQKLCPVCWAFSIIGVMESRAFIKNYGFNRLSIQELIDCSFDNERSKTGCHAGRPIVDALWYLCDKQLKITTEANYPLTLVDEKCHRTAPGIRGIRRFVNSCDMYKNESKLLEALYKGPVTAMVNAKFLFNYNKGIIAENCETTEDKLNHAVQLVGYDMTGDTPYYIMKNSWDTDWGEEGYARLAFGSNQCGVAFSIGYFDVN